jgi:hypothetical protein
MGGALGVAGRGPWAAPQSGVKFGAALGRVEDVEAGLGDRVAEVTQGLGALPVGTEAFEDLDLLRRLRRRRDQRR